MKFLTFVFFLPSLTTSSYILDESWPKELPSYATYFSAIAINGEEIHVSARMNTTQPILTFNDGGELLSSWGAEEISFNGELGSWGAHGLASQEDRLWVADIQDDTTKVFSGSGDSHKLLGIAGTKDRSGDGVDVLQFSSTADIAIGTGELEGEVWVSDGDGGSNHRVGKSVEVYKELSVAGVFANPFCFYLVAFTVYVFFLLNLNVCFYGYLI